MPQFVPVTQQPEAMCGHPPTMLNRERGVLYLNLYLLINYLDVVLADAQDTY